MTVGCWSFALCTGPSPEVRLAVLPPYNCLGSAPSLSVLRGGLGKNLTCFRTCTPSLPESCVRCSTAFSGNDGPNRVLVAEANRSESCPNDTRSLLYSSRTSVLLSVLQWDEALPMKVRAALLQPLHPPQRSDCPC